MLRKILFWCHLTLGAAIAVFVLVMSATGVLLTYEKQIQTWADLRGLDGAAPSGDATSAPLDQLVASARTARKGNPTAVRWRFAPDDPVEVLFGNQGSVFLNGYTGEVLGTGAAGVRSFFRGVTDWHRWLARKGELRNPARNLMAAANLGFLLMVVSGFFLWWPRNLTRAAFRNVLFFRRGLRAKARDFNWHNVVGIWSLVPLFIVVASAVVISYPWAGDVVNRVAGESGRARAQRARMENSAVATQGGVADMDALIARAKGREAEWRTLTLQLAPAKNGNVTFSIDRSLGGQPQKRGQLVLDPGGRVVKWESFADQDGARRARSIIRFAHTGEIGGVIGQTIAGLVSAGTLLLVYTGIALALRRWAAWRQRRGEQRGSARESETGRSARSRPATAGS